MGSLTRRPYLLVGFFHFIIGFFLFGCGAVWLVMTFVYFPKHKDLTQTGGWDAETFLKENPWAKMPVEHQVWAWLVYTVQLWTGFWVCILVPVYIDTFCLQYFGRRGMLRNDFLLRDFDFL